MEYTCALVIIIIIIQGYYII